MIIDDTMSIEITTDAAVTDLRYFTSAINDSGSALTNVVKSGASTGTSAVKIVDTPAATNYRTLKYALIQNTAAVSRSLSLYVNAAATPRSIRSITMAAGASIEYVMGRGWTLYNSDGTLAEYTLAGTNEQVQYNNAGVLAGASRVLIDDNDLVLAESTAPIAPSSAQLKLIAQSIAGRYLPKAVGPSNLQMFLQPHVGKQKIGVWMPFGNSATLPTAEGIASPTAAGTATLRAVAVTNFVTAMRRIGFVSGTAAGSMAGWRGAVLQFYRGDAAGRGGFQLIVRFASSDAAAVAGARTFVGFTTGIAAPTNVEPSSQTNILGLGCDTADSTFSIMHNDGAGTATKVSLGAGFPANTLSQDAYELALFCPPNDATVQYRVENLVTSVVASGTLSTNLPANNQLLALQGWRTNNATLLAVGIDLISCYIESDN